MGGESTNVVVNAELTTKDTVPGDQQKESEDDANEEANLETALKRIARLESELKSVNTEMDCKIHGEFDAMRRYVDRAIEINRLRKRP